MIGGMQFLSGSHDVPGWGDEDDRAERLARRLAQAAVEVSGAVPVIGLAAPALEGMLSEWQSGDSVQLTLTYGFMVAPVGRMWRS